MPVLPGNNTAFKAVEAAQKFKAGAAQKSQQSLARQRTQTKGQKWGLASAAVRLNHVNPKKVDGKGIIQAVSGTGPDAQQKLSVMGKPYEASLLGDDAPDFQHTISTPSVDRKHSSAGSILPEDDVDELLEERSAEIRLSKLSGGQTWRTQLPWVCYKVVKNPVFDVVSLCVVIVDAVQVGAEIQSSQRGDNPVFFVVLENLCLVWYITEFGIWVGALGSAWTKKTWLIVDCILCVVGVLIEWIVAPILKSIQSKVRPSGVILLFTRLLRLLRLGRTLRLLWKFKELMRLANGIRSSLSTTITAVFLLFSMLYFFGCFCVEFITNSSLVRQDEAFKGTVDEYYPDLWISMMSLFQYMGMDSTASQYFYIVKRAWYLLSMYVLLILVVHIILMNLVSAVMIEATLDRTSDQEEAAAEKEQKARQQLISRLNEICQRIDWNGNGSLSFNELDGAVGSTVFRELCDRVGIAEPADVLKILDVTEGDDIEIKEFIADLVALSDMKTPVIYFEIDKRFQKMELRLQRFEKELETMHDQLEKFLARREERLWQRQNEKSRDANIMASQRDELRRSKQGKRKVRVRHKVDLPESDINPG